MFASTLLALALFAAPEAAAANAGAAAPAAQAQPAAEAKPKKTCVKQPEVSGSRLAKKVCVTETPKAAPADAKAEDKPAA
ncbi:hypothetical protein LRS10_11835 [Phenylobacterium sp. J426]|uniref:hypothetical protein n=1 Tax=Phenylobacterium sp. J426 TaxID=2898439 RepID=UPI00215111C4|nr:hypothetical protein [Phenylobacterium sp. J426]MCR5874796.1 hypothetical protein [Phenylobacterium sp. J426]